MQRFLKRKHTEQEESESLTFTSSAPTSFKRPVRIFKFNNTWKNDRPWLYYENDKMFCSYCKKYVKTSTGNKFISGYDSLLIENVRSHEVSTSHKTNHTIFLNSTKSTAKQPIYKAILNIEKHDLNLMKKLFTTVFYVTIIKER